MYKRPENDKIFTRIEKLLRKTNDPSQDDGASDSTKRALLIGVSYQGHDPKLMPHLAGTEEDVKKIAKTLVETQGYQLSNIRVLVNGHRASHVPNKSNILKGLDWLVKGCRPKDFRVFAFSGHGFDDPQPVECANRKVYDKNRPLVRFDKEQPSSSNVRAMMYSQEAIAPQDVRWYQLPTEPDSDSDSDTELQSDRAPGLRIGAEAPGEKSKGSLTPTTVQQLAPVGGVSRELLERRGWGVDHETLIFDTELNESLSSLPEDSTLTCIFDCCHSGRILSLPFKLGGGGHRAGMLITRHITPTNESQIEGEVAPGISTATEMAERSSPDPQLPVSSPVTLVNNLGLAQGMCKAHITDKGRPDSVTFGVGHSEFHPRRSDIAERPAGHQPLDHESQCDRNNRNDVECEHLPKAEQETNKILARVFCWSAAHQRQAARELFDPKLNIHYGAFTKTFCEVVDSQYKNRASDVLQQGPVITARRNLGVAQADPLLTYRVLLDYIAEAVNHEVKRAFQEANKTGAPSTEQFVQLWSTLDLPLMLEKQFEM